VLAAIRAASGGSAIVTPLDPWRHDLSATDRFAELWPFLLVLALLLWPIDIALRRMSLGRREFVAARDWVAGIPRRRGATARRTTTGESLLAARERAGSSEARAALLNASAPTAPPVGATALDSPATSPPTHTPPLRTARPRPEPNVRTSSPGPSAPPAGPSPATSGTSAGVPRSSTPSEPASPPNTMKRLRDAKRRARER
jgi:hypothetical protein